MSNHEATDAFAAHEAGTPYWEAVALHNDTLRGDNTMLSELAGRQGERIAELEQQLAASEWMLGDAITRIGEYLVMRDSLDSLSGRPTLAAREARRDVANRLYALRRVVNPALPSHD